MSGEGIESRPCEFRASADARTIAGVAIRYGDVSPTHNERFLPGAFIPLPDAVALNLMHDAGAPVGDAFPLDTGAALEFRAAVRPDSAAAKLIGQGLTRGASIEFRSVRESRDDAGVRVIEAAELLGIGIVASPSYADSRVELRHGADSPLTVPLWWR